MQNLEAQLLQAATAAGPSSSALVNPSPNGEVKEACRKADEATQAALEKTVPIGLGLGLVPAGRGGIVR